MKLSKTMNEIMKTITKLRNKNLITNSNTVMEKKKATKTFAGFKKILLKKGREDSIKKKIYIKTSVNNTIISTLNFKKNHIMSCGHLGFQGAKRGTTYAAQKLGEEIGRLLYAQKEYKDITVILRGIRKGKRNILKALKKKIKIRQVIEKTSLSHNGCRPRKKKRR